MHAQNLFNQYKARIQDIIQKDITYLNMEGKLNNIHILVDIVKRVFFGVLERNCDTQLPFLPEYTQSCNFDRHENFLHEGLEGKLFYAIAFTRLEIANYAIDKSNFRIFGNRGQQDRNTIQVYSDRVLQTTITYDFMSEFFIAGVLQRRRRVDRIQKVQNEINWETINYRLPIKNNTFTTYEELQDLLL